MNLEKSIYYIFENFNIDAIVKNKADFYIESQIPKKKGGYRKLYSAVNELHEINKLLKPELQEYRLSNSSYHLNISHGYEYGKSIFTNASFHIKKYCVVNVDLKNFFPSLGWKYFKKSFDFFLSDNLLKSFYEISTINNGLPIGTSISPVLSNILIDKLDLKLNGLNSNSNNITRYVDDITFSTNGKTIPKEIVSQIESIVNSEGLELNTKKTRWYYQCSRQIVTGLTVNDKVTTSRKFRLYLRIYLYKIENSKNEITRDEINYLNGIKGLLLKESSMLAKKLVLKINSITTKNNKKIRLSDLPYSEHVQIGIYRLGNLEGIKINEKNVDLDTILNRDKLNSGRTYMLSQVDKDAYYALPLKTGKLPLNVKATVKELIRIYLTNDVNAPLAKELDLRIENASGNGFELNRSELVDYYKKFVYMPEVGGGLLNFLSLSKNLRQHIYMGRNRYQFEWGEKFSHTQTVKSVNHKLANFRLKPKDFIDNQLENYVDSLYLNINRRYIRDNYKGIDAQGNIVNLFEGDYINFIKSNLFTNLLTVNLGTDTNPKITFNIQTRHPFKIVEQESKITKEEVIEKKKKK